MFVAKNKNKLGITRTGQKQLGKSRKTTIAGQPAI